MNGTENDFDAGMRCAECMIAAMIWRMGLNGALNHSHSMTFVTNSRFGDGEVFAYAQFRARHDTMTPKEALDEGAERER